MKGIYDNFNNIKYVLALFAIAIVGFSVYYSNRLADEMSKVEQERIELWAEATRRLVSDDNSDLNFILRVIDENKNIPVLIADADSSVSMSRNIEINDVANKNFWKDKIIEFSSAHAPIAIQLDEKTTHYLYYDDSTLLKKLAYFPYIQWLIISCFCLVMFFVFTSAKKAEQDRVWAGLSKETAHQLGTPISSLLAWLEMLKMEDVDHDIVCEMDKDVSRLKTIAERFSKIGSIPEMEPLLLNETISASLAYMQKRTSSKIVIKPDFMTSDDLAIMANKPLIEWVIENLCKNAIDAMEGYGRISVSTSLSNNKVIIDVEDTGKGIAKSKFKTIFRPGYTTKKRGWGLGLSLVKRIVEVYHHGKIFVKRSEIAKGTTFRIIIPVK